MTFENVKMPVTGAGGHALTSHVVTVSQVVTATDLVERSMALERTLQAGEFAGFCEQKIATSSEESDANIWQFLRVRNLYICLCRRK